MVPREKPQPSRTPGLAVVTGRSGPSNTEEMTMKAKATNSAKAIKTRAVAPGNDVRSKHNPATRTEASPVDLAPPRGVAHPASKKGAIEALIRRPEGSAMSELIAATGWQKHSVRSALTLLRKAGCTITCEHTDTATRYRLVAAGRTTTGTVDRREQLRAADR